MSMLVMSLAFQMQLEAKLTGYYRQRLKTQNLARAGIEWAKFMMIKSSSSFPDEEMYGEEFRIQLKNLQRGLSLQNIKKPTMLEGFQMEGDFTVSIEPEPGRRNVNYLERFEWEEILEQAGLPVELHIGLIECFEDWVDADDNQKLDGAEEDDAFYRDKDYSVKNAPVDTLDELLLIKNWNDAILFGGTWPDDDELVVSGIARLLTTWGTGKLNVNSASAQVLRSLPGMDDEDRLALVLRARIKDPADPEDDGFNSPSEFISVAGLDPSWAGRLSTTDKKFIRITSIGEYEGVKFGVWCVFRQDGRKLLPVLWREETLP